MSKSVESELISLRKQLDKLNKETPVDNSTAGDVITRLEKTKVTVELLQKTMIGTSVNTLRKLDGVEKQVASRAKNLVKGWKKLLPGTPSSGGGGGGGGVGGGGGGEIKEQKSNGGGGERGAVRKASQTQKIDLPRTQETGNAVRDSCRKMIATALATDGTAKQSKVIEIACAIESCVFREFKGDTGSKYKTRVRSRYLNLKDPKNPKLRDRVLMGKITPEQISVMSAEEMASDELTELRQEMNKEAIHNSFAGQNSTTQTDQFKCGKCKQRNCSYYQMQTRSADEPMTTFVTCNECGTRWKFC
eukprot:Nk52_evm6s684 gene=Nk52_evmTU6s684